MPTEEQIIQNLKKCPSFEGGCNRNLCPLDLELGLRTGGEADKCRWMRERQDGTITFRDKSGVERKFEATGSPQMPDELLKFVPYTNIKFLNQPSRKRWFELRKGCLPIESIP